MGEWNNSPRRVTIASFYMDEHEVRNIDWLEYLNWLQRVFVSYPEEYRKALPDTLVWREQLAYNEPMVTNYLRFPSFFSHTHIIPLASGKVGHHLASVFFSGISYP